MKANGNLIADDTIAVDLWKSNSRASLHFLTHLHADHIVGLSKYWQKPIYTSEINCKLIPCFIQGLDPSLLRPLRLNEETLIELPNGYAKLFLFLFSLNHLPDLNETVHYYIIILLVSVLKEPFGMRVIWMPQSRTNVSQVIVSC